MSKSLLLETTVHTLELTFILALFKPETAIEIFSFLICNKSANSVVMNEHMDPTSSQVLPDFKFPKQSLTKILAVERIAVFVCLTSPPLTAAPENTLRSYDDSKFAAFGLRLDDDVML
ncbi:hypothetical protein AVEN_173860-1 [Araneus ventricosus]|uniref:Uncharacterized protein n=1 Tax=Araneus ventricosus TaxID=182803 RepID=A0A4Y2I0I0_ARAVE|nr:hypothetical protein AVEN_173860-1 [Araneus ventricosus]